jgi:phosphatidylserine decarboxylase
MLDRAKLTALRLLPKNAVSRAAGAASDLPLPGGVRTVVNKGFASLAGIDLSEAEQGPDAYGSLNAFFTRRLKDGARTVAATSEDVLVSPSDGRLSHFGPITRQTLVQAKGRDYRLVDLLDSGRDAEAFVDGHFATIYLSPRDYHRVHFPMTGKATDVAYIPGHLFPVNPFAVENIDELFAVNERLITYVENPVLGKVGVVMVGATCVGRMSLAFHDHVTNGHFRRRETFELSGNPEFEAGDELGMFNLGSTVVLVIAKSSFKFSPDLVPGQPVRMGQLLGQI